MSAPTGNPLHRIPHPSTAAADEPAWWQAVSAILDEVEDEAFKRAWGAAMRAAAETREAALIAELAAVRRELAGAGE